ncbi:MAG: carboxypeptidase-like regulatory domain-containing protein [Bacteroidales bacterium]|nr:carboxypeptidase-like regulatory domain-containing protein [Bacteroidales bacterium]
MLTIVMAGKLTLSGQQNTIRGRIMDSSSQEPVKFAHIENYSAHRTAITDTNGWFRLQANPGDTLVFSAIGYYYSKAIVTDLLLDQEVTPVFELHQRIYEIEEAVIYVPGTYSEFRQDFIGLDIADSREEVLKQELTSIAAIEGKKAYEEAIDKGELKPPSGFPILSADEKARLRLKRHLEREEILSLINEKYNVDLVKEITGLTDEDEVMSFMLFCNFDVQYLLEVNPPDLMQVIAEKYEVFKSIKTG